MIAGRYTMQCSSFKFLLNTNQLTNPRGLLQVHAEPLARLLHERGHHHGRDHHGAAVAAAADAGGNGAQNLNTMNVMLIGSKIKK